MAHSSFSSSYKPCIDFFPVPQNKTQKYPRIWPSLTCVLPAKKFRRGQTSSCRHTTLLFLRKVFCFGCCSLFVFVLTDFTRAVHKGIPNLCFQRLVNSSVITQKPWPQFSPAGDNYCHVCLPIGEFSRNRMHLNSLKVISDLDGHSRHPILSQKCVAYLFFPQYFEVKMER